MGPEVAGLNSLEEFMLAVPVFDSAGLAVMSDEQLAALRGLPGGDEPADSWDSDED
jgi:hypothetical protein